MRTHFRMARPERTFSTIRHAARFTVLPRPIVRKDTISSRVERGLVEPSLTAQSTRFQLDPYLDYGRFLTAEGGILIIYKDLDLRWRHTIWRLLAWTIFTGLEAYYLFNPLQTNQWLAIGFLLAAAIVNWFIVAKPVELYRRVEIRSDCIIIDGTDVFWARFIEGGFPSCRRDAEGNLVLSGTYGTRFVEYLTIRRFDEYDRMPEVMSAHLQEAMRQLWMMPH